MQAWWAEETSLKNINNLTVQKLLIGNVYIRFKYIYIYIIYNIIINNSNSK